MDNTVTIENSIKDESNGIEDYTKIIIRDDSELQEDNWFSYGLKQQQKEKEMENTEQTNEQQTTGEDIKIIDFLELEKEYPLSIQALKDWFLSRFQIENAEIIMEQYSMLITDGQRGMFLNPRDLYDFFDSHNVRPFIIPEADFPKVKYVIQSKKSFIESEDIYDDRGAAETEAFIRTFYFTEVTIQHRERKS